MGICGKRDTKIRIQRNSMNYCLTVKRGIILDGYQTIEIKPIIGFEQINTKIEDATAKDIIAEDIFCYYDITKQDGILELLAKKLRRSGILSVGCFDIDLLYNYMNTEHDINNINAVMYGNAGIAIKSISDSTTVQEKLSSLGLQILNVRYEGTKSLIKAGRM